RLAVGHRARPRGDAGREDEAANGESGASNHRELPSLVDELGAEPHALPVADAPRELPASRGDVVAAAPAHRDDQPWNLERPPEGVYRLGRRATELRPRERVERNQVDLRGL